MNPKVSIVIPVYNGSNYMREAIDSALNQTYSNIEVIVVNDGSKDNTEEIALSYGDKIRYFYQENGGASAALNRGISLMTGDYFQYLPHDDFLAPEKIKKQIKKLEESGLKEAVIWSGWDMYLQSEKKYKDVIYPYVHDFNNEVTKGVYPMLFSLITIITVLFPKKYLDEVGEFNPKLSTAQDYDLMYRVFQGRDTLYVDETLAHYRWHDSQLTQTDEEFMKNCRSIAMFMEDAMTDNEINRLFGSKYNFLFRILDHYKLMGWEDCYNRSIKTFEEYNEIYIDEEKNSQILFDLGMEGKKIFLYCAGRNSRAVAHYFRQRNIKIEAIGDGNELIWNKTVNGLRVISKNEIDKNNSYIVVTKDNPEDLVCLLRSEGYKSVTSFKDIGKRIYDIIPKKGSIIDSWNNI